MEAEVRWCVAQADGTFRAGLERLGSLDCYEAMQLSPRADAETISRVYRLLAARYHPDNRETGNSEKFIRLSEAYQILSNPEKRARYDAGYRGPSTGNPVERRRRIDGGSRQGRRKGDKLPPSVGALRGWNSALRHPSF
jgi:curved DNA-binding protein CbpA